MTELLAMMATPLWAYLALFGFLTVDAMIPVVPTQAIMITSGALTVYGNLSLPLVIAVGAAGMFAGDTIAFLLGRSTGQVGRGWLAALRARCAPRHDEAPRERSKTRKAAVRFTRGLRKPGPLVLLLCRFVPGGRMAAGFHAGRTGYPMKLFVLYDAAAALCWAGYGGLVGHVGGTAITQSAWRLFVIAAAAALVFGTAGWILALSGGRKEIDAELAVDAHLAAEAELALELEVAEAVAEADVIAARAASADEQLPRSTRTATGR
ncbi:DedA family protein [Actinoplanes sp. KI2]|uniref:DedA family protein n=1 Tax=Actinoplanes sp. KI2 TaxID=2983315 RepID=UPI0021D5AF58|nr:DedA family protein [Actinoplanes sp. KI2]MCU7726717.1 DedA family protein [Actinoplanes sp. KI2]